MIKSIRRVLVTLGILAALVAPVAMAAPAAQAITYQPNTCTDPQIGVTYIDDDPYISEIIGYCGSGPDSTYKVRVQWGKRSNPGSATTTTSTLTAYGTYAFAAPPSGSGWYPRYWWYYSNSRVIKTEAFPATTLVTY